MNRDNREYFLHFFTPTPELTRAIAEANRELLHEDMEEGLTASDLAEMDEEEGEHNIDDFGALLVGDRERDAYRPDRETAGYLRAPTLPDYQHLISKRLHGYLAFLARGEQARGGRLYDLYDIVPDGMERRLGLNHRARRCRGLLEDLAGEFGDGMMRKHDGHFRARWGEIHMETPRLVVLVEREAEGREPSAPYRRATLTTRATRAAGGRRGR